MSQGFIKGIALDTDGTLAADSDLLVSSQKAVKTFVDNSIAAITPSPIQLLGQMTNEYLHTGTVAFTKIYELLIPGGTIGNNDSIRISYKARKASGAGVLVLAPCIHNTNVIAPSTQLSNCLIGNNQFISGEGNIKWQNANNVTMSNPPTNSSYNRFGVFTGAAVATTYDNTGDLYVMFGATATAVADIQTIYEVRVELIKG